jgi:hypothetical protein
MRKLHELSEPLKAILQDELDKRIPKTDFRQATLFRIADLLLVMQIKLLEANKTKLDSKTYKDNLNALETLNLAFVMMTDLEGENYLLRNELLTLRHEAEIIIAELTERVKTLEMIDDL